MNLALQGGGAHGAFAWGVLDRLLEDERIAFEGVCATSAGAMNAAVLALRLAEGGRQGARQALANFWRRVSHAARCSPLQPTLLDRISHDHGSNFSPAFLVFDLMTRMLSPYQFNPANFNPLRGILEETIDFERLRSRAAVKLLPLGHQRAHRQGQVFDTPRSRPTPCWPRPACRSCSRRSRSTARPTGTAATWATPPSFR